MLKYFCLVVLIMSSFGWNKSKSQYVILWNSIGSRVHPNQDHEKVRTIKYYKVNDKNIPVLTRIVEFGGIYEGNPVKEDISYLNGERHGMYYKYGMGSYWNPNHGSELESWGNYINGQKEGKWYEYDHMGDDSIQVMVFNNDLQIDTYKISKPDTSRIFKPIFD